MNKVCQKAVASSLTVLLLGLLCACSNSTQLETSSPESTELVGAQEQDSETASVTMGTTSSDETSAAQSPHTYTLEEIQDAPGSYFIMRGNSFESAESCEVEATSEADTAYYYPVEGTEFGYAPTLDLTEGDILVTTSDSETMTFLSPEGYGYFADDAWKISPHSWETINGVDIPENWNDLDNIEQETFLSEILNPLGITLNQGDVPVAALPVTLTYGEFVGTKYTEHTVELNVPFYHRFIGFWGDQGDESIVMCPVNETKEGYFIVDTSALEPGTYLINGSSTGYMNYALLNVAA